MKMKVVVCKDIREDLSFNPFAILRKERVTRLSKIIEMEVANGCCSAPLRVGQSILLKPSGDSLHINEYSNIEYNVSSNMWYIWLSTWYTIRFDTKVKECMDQYGFDRATVIVP